MAVAGEFMGILQIEEEEERLRRNRHRLLTRHLRDESNPFELTELKFLKLFRLNKIAVQHLIEILSPHMDNEHRSTAIPKHLKILCAIHFYGHHSYQLDAGGNHIFALSQPSVSRCISQISEIINEFLLHQWIKFPTDREAIQQNIEMFQNRYNFPGIVGVIDCSHIAIVAPPILHQMYPAGPYYNIKGYYSINTQIICNPKTEIINMNARFPGSTHDSAIWRTSTINKHLRTEYLYGNLNYHIIGDEGYPLLPWLMVKYPGELPDNTPEGRFNSNLIRARTIIERVIGILKGHFRCLLKHITLHYNPIKAAKIIYACGVLHNIALHFNAPIPDDVDIVPIENDVNDGIAHVENFFQRGVAKRAQITEEFFV